VGLEANEDARENGAIVRRMTRRSTNEKERILEIFAAGFK
jgi:hypothetical protein